jgi:serine/threonine protein kinase
MHMQEAGRLFCLCTELCAGGSLVDVLCARESRTGTPAEVCEWGVQLGRAVRYLHEDMEVLHDDIKADNILFDDAGRVKLADLGLAAELGDGQKLLRCVSCRVVSTCHVTVSSASLSHCAVPPQRPRTCALLSSRSVEERACFTCGGHVGPGLRARRGNHWTISL